MLQPHANKNHLTMSMRRSQSSYTARVSELHSNTCINNLPSRYVAYCALLERISYTKQSSCQLLYARIRKVSASKPNLLAVIMLNGPLSRIMMAFLLLLYISCFGQPCGRYHRSWYGKGNYYQKTSSFFSLTEVRTKAKTFQLSACVCYFRSVGYKYCFQLRTLHKLCSVPHW